MNQARTGPVLSLVDVCLGYEQSRTLLRRRNVQVLKNVGFDLYSGTTIGILGRNGAGKSSLLRVMAGILRPDSGRVVRHRPDLKISLQSMALGFQARLSGRENAIMGCLLMGLTRHEAEALLPKIVEFSGLSHCIDEALSTYSSGMRARLGFSVAYYTKSDVMLIDEALGVGDHEFRLKSREAMLSAIASDRTAVLVSHDETLLSEQCDELIWLENGRLVMRGKPGKVLAYYHDYDHMVRQLAKDLSTTVEVVRAHPNSEDPQALLQSLRGKLKATRVRDRKKLGVGPVKYFYPSRREILSQLVAQDCGSTVWVENTRLLAKGSDRAVRNLYLEYEDLVYRIAKTTGTNRKTAHRSQLNRQLVELLARIS